MTVQAYKLQSSSFTVYSTSRVEIAKVRHDTIMAGIGCSGIIPLHYMPQVLDGVGKTVRVIHG